MHPQRVAHLRPLQLKSLPANPRHKDQKRREEESAFEEGACPETRMKPGVICLIAEHTDGQHSPTL